LASSLASERPLQIREHLADRGGVAGAREPGRRRHPAKDIVGAAAVDVGAAGPVEPPRGEERLALGVVAVGQVRRRREHVLGAGAGVVGGVQQARHGAATVRGRLLVVGEGAVEAEHLRGRRHLLRLVAVVVRVVARHLDLHHHCAVVLGGGGRLDVVVVHRVVPLDHALLVVDPAQHPVVQLVQRQRNSANIIREDRSGRKKKPLAKADGER
jgi:hypothetical protein